MRTQAHIIDTKAVKAVMAQLPDHWVVRELSERDYGIDLMVEIFAPGSEDAKGKEAFEPTGGIFHIQIKGTGEKLQPAQKTGTVNYSIEKKSLRYVENFSSPFFLFRVSVSEPQTIYFLWLQQYIREVMDVETPFWRDESEDSITVRIPQANKLQKGLKKLESIAFRPKYLEQLVEYYESYQHLGDRLDAISLGTHIVNAQVVSDLKNVAYRMRRLSVLMSRNDCCIDTACIDELIEYIRELDDPSGIKQPFPHRVNFELLAHSLSGMSLVEKMIAENEGLSAF